MSTARINLFWLVLFTLTLPIAVVVSTRLAGRSFERVKLGQQSVRVKGYAEKKIVSDRASWSAGVVQRDADRTTAYQALERDTQTVLAYLKQHGFADEAVTLGPVSIEQVYARDAKGNRTNTIERYEVSRSLSITSTDVNRITETARESGVLVGEGIELNASSPSYLYTQLDDMKLTMLSEATANARDRAKLLVESAGNTLGSLVEASQGVFQITPEFSSEVSGYGENDTSSLNKVIKAVVTTEYLIAH